MIRVKHKISSTRLALGGSMITIASGLFVFGTELGLKGISAIISMFLFGIGIVLSLAGIFEIFPRYKLILKWDDNLIKKALLSAPPRAKVRILQTWLPDKEIFCPFLQDILKDEGKQFDLDILLMDSGEKTYDILKARVELRAETYADGKNYIRSTIERFKKLKDEVDRAWEKKHMGAKLNLNIRRYKFLPFGPMYQINESHFFIGFYLNYESSVHAPMLVICSKKSRLWKVFDDHFNKGWKNSWEINLDEKETQENP
jgi:hypothetical protein